MSAVQIFVAVAETMRDQMGTQNSVKDKKTEPIVPHCDYTGLYKQERKPLSARDCAVKSSEIKSWRLSHAYMVYCWVGFIFIKLAGIIFAKRVTMY